MISRWRMKPAEFGPQKTDIKTNNIKISEEIEDTTTDFEYQVEFNSMKYEEMEVEPEFIKTQLDELDKPFITPKGWELNTTIMNHLSEQCSHIFSQITVNQISCGFMVPNTFYPWNLIQIEFKIGHKNSEKSRY